MKKLIIYSILIVALLSSCSKRNESIAPKVSNTEEAIAKSIVINNNTYSKSADVYATKISSLNNTTEYSSSFLVNTNISNGNVAFSLITNTPDLSKGTYNMASENSNVSIQFTSEGQKWASSLGHQKGSKFIVLSSKECETHTGYVKEVLVQVSCALYNTEGQYIPFKCITSIKF